jgi:hypothetical protein
MEAGRYGARMFDPAPWHRSTTRGRLEAGARGLGVALVVVVGALTIAAEANAFAPTRVASSYERVVGRGELWTLMTSAIVADNPVWISLASFAAIVLVALLVCGGQLFWLAAVAGHVGSAASIYLVMAVLRAVDAGLFTGSLLQPDFGVSTMQGGLLGATAFVLWRRSTTRAGRLLVGAGVAGVGLIAWKLHPDPSVLTYEHHVAFLLGIVAARLVLGRAERRIDPAPVPA